MKLDCLVIPHVEVGYETPEMEPEILLNVCQRM